MFKNKKIYLYDLNMNLIKEFNSTQECATFLNKDTMYLYHNLKYCSRIRHNDNWYILRRDKYVEKN